MTLAAVIGQPRAIETLKAALAGGSLHHAYLFAGPEGVGKELAAIGLAQALACEKAPLVGCGGCGPCQRIARRNHPDVTWVMPEDEQVARGLAGRSDFDHTPSREIRVDQIRALQERLSFRALEAPRKVVIVASAHQMNDKAQNAFLKTLEEPPQGTVLVLLASATERLLPTIRSRCSRVTFGPLPLSQIAARLKEEKKLDAASAELVAVMAGGSLSRALELDVKTLARRKEIIERFEALSKDDARGWLQYAEEFGGSREDAEDCVRVLEVWLQDVAVLGAGGEGIANRDLLETARAAAQRLPPVALHRRHRLAGRALTAVSERNGAPRLQLERMLIEMLAR
ncbi:MAG: DNA polymerase III subunit delta' [Myxococcaceae bacterium]